MIEERGHIYNHELAGSSFFSGVMIAPRKKRRRERTNRRGTTSSRRLHLNSGYADSSTGLICLENTANLAGGSVMTAEQCADVCRNAHAIGIPVHMDGARIQCSGSDGFVGCRANAALRLVQFCLSKGLGGPVGSVLVGSNGLH